MIITQLIGGLGNQMFQYAVARRLSAMRGVTFKMDIRIFDNYPKSCVPRYYELGNFNVKEVFASQDEIDDIIKKNKIKGEDLGREKGELTFNPMVLDYTDDIYFRGYWQSEKYFSDVRNDLLQEFSLKNALSKDALQCLNDIASSLNSISLHIRRGDYVEDKTTNQFHGVCDLEYYYHAIEILRRKFGAVKLYVFSDDIAWVKENFVVEENTMYVSELVKNNVEELFLMSRCTHHIIANSTFSWWGAWLGKAENKIVIAPKRWFKKDVAIDIIPDDWMKI